MRAIAECAAIDRRRRPCGIARVAALVVALVALGLPATAMADWPLYGHDLANSRDAGAAGPSPSQLGSISAAWAFTTPTGDFTGTPVISRGVLVAGNNGGWIYALDPVSGRVLWSKDVGQPINGTAAIDPHAPHGGAVYVPVAQLGAPRLLALSLRDGTTRWDTTLTNQSNSTVFGSPVYWRHTLYIGTSGPLGDNSTARGSVVALDQKTGAVRWQTFTVPPDRDGAPVWSTPAIDTTTAMTTLRREVFSRCGGGAVVVTAGALTIGLATGGRGGGVGAGIDRLVMTLAGTENVREVQAFPKTQTGYDPLLDAPADVDPKLLEELGLRVVAKAPKA